jgi:iron complex transport system substrate-binding protein
MKLTGFCLVLLMLLPLGCTPSLPDNPTSDPVTQDVTRSAASRVVALTPITADIIARLDQTKLVGIAGNRLLNQNQALKAIPRVSEGRTQPNLEKIVALKPDLVIGATGFHDQVLEKLRSLGVKTLATELNNWRSLEELTRTLATAIQADPELLLKEYQEFFSKQPLQSASTLVLVSRQPMLSPNQTSWAGDLLTRFGGVNLVAELQGQSPMRGYVTLSPEKVLQANPDVLILVETEGGNIQKLKSESFWQDLKAVQNNRVYSLDYYGFVNAGSIEAISQACKKLKQIYAVKSAFN